MIARLIPLCVAAAFRPSEWWMCVIYSRFQRCRSASEAEIARRNDDRIQDNTKQTHTAYHDKHTHRHREVRCGVPPWYTSVFSFETPTSSVEKWLELDFLQFSFPQDEFLVRFWLLHQTWRAANTVPPCRQSCKSDPIRQLSIKFMADSAVRLINCSNFKGSSWAPIFYSFLILHDHEEKMLCRVTALFPHVIRIGPLCFMCGRHRLSEFILWSH